MEELLRRPPLQRIPPQAPAQEVPSLLGDPARELGHVGGEGDLVESAKDVRDKRPWGSSGGHLDDGASQGPDISWRALLSPPRDLRRHEHWRAPHASPLVLVLLLWAPRAPEVRNLGPPTGADQHVLALQIAMDDAVGMQVGQPAEDVACVGSDGELVKPPALLLDLVRQRAPGSVLHEKIIAATGSWSLGRDSSDDLTAKTSPEDTDVASETVAEVPRPIIRPRRHPLSPILRTPTQERERKEMDDSVRGEVADIRSNEECVLCDLSKSTLLRGGRPRSPGSGTQSATSDSVGTHDSRFPVARCETGGWKSQRTRWLFARAPNPRAVDF
ncbi:hypothetical protein B296_00047171 [Ensete ventricosum]|uniref:Uncharacterized protein n=1 Tax=Ensete ventricosum TaxID=4639 RepID=A0A426X1B9_ENSVE|nr:hypothetical protein B296_00047171 [Ensete ventricosum]